MGTLMVYSPLALVVDYLAVLAAERTVYGKLRSLDGIVGSGIYHASAHWE